MAIAAEPSSPAASGGNPKQSPSPAPSSDLSPPPPSPTKKEIAAAKRRATLARNKEAARVAARERFVFGVEEEEEPDPNAPIYCTCRKPDDGTVMVECGNSACEIVWFHARCVEEEATESKDWICRNCKDSKTQAELWRNGVPGSLSHDDLDKIVPPPAEVLRAPAGDVYGLSSWKKDWMKENIGEQQQHHQQQQSDQHEDEDWEEYEEDWEAYEENEEMDE
ncbi:hypothetical protein PRZ48_008806 [Zasmidium cellare]|uniref:PHD-type domain-containing protein n=1 Tax=Zasmidium cellare TaxID=395010 RepID=A0ABR0EGI6_ZASCE|nr:hypothetical protein PRZ48_008806 [Zasmidium cellare]